MLRSDDDMVSAAAYTVNPMIECYPPAGRGRSPGKVGGRPPNGRVLNPRMAWLASKSAL